jgi:hypothetical protein
LLLHHEKLGQSELTRFFALNAGQVSVVCVTRRRCAATHDILYVRPVAHPAGYGTNDVPNPPYIGYEIA